MRSGLAAFFALTVVTCAAPAAVAPATELHAPGLSATPAPIAAATVTATATPMPPPSRMPINELSQVFRPLEIHWRPSGPTLMFVASEGDYAQTLVAVPFGPSGRTSEPVRLVTFTAEGWDLRSDGGALVAAVRTSDGGVRLATWDIAAGTGRWITPLGPNAFVSSPIWSKDGLSIFFASAESGALSQIGADGQGQATIARLDRFGGPMELTPDGRGLIWSKGQEGGSAEIFDLGTGTNRHLADVAQVVSWRAQQPRILLKVGGCCAGRPGGSLVAFDDAAMTSRAIADQTPNANVAFLSGGWDPAGTRIAAWKYDDLASSEASLVIIDTGSGEIRKISDLVGHGVVLWLNEGIIVTRTLSRNGTTDVAFVLPAGGAAMTLYRGQGIGRLVVVRP